MAQFLAELADPNLVASFQKWCGVSFVEEENAGGESGRYPAIVNNGRCPNGGSSWRQKTADATLEHEPSAVNNNNNNNNDKSTCNGVGAINEALNHRGDSRATETKFPVRSCDSGNRSCLSQRYHHSLQKSGDSLNNKVLPRVTEPHTNGKGGKGAGKIATRVSIRYPLLYYWAKVGAFLGNEEFYLTGMPYLMWTVDSALIRQTAVVWWLVMYLGQAGKDYLAWPRPPSPPVVRLETTHQAEYSMPSTHAMAGTAIPLLLATLLLDRYQLPTLPVVCLAALWCFTTGLSRLYLGVHTVLDVLCGFLISLTLYVVVSPLTSGYDLYQQTHPLAPVVLVLTSLALCTICYPSGPGKNSAKRDAITTTSVFVGVGMGVWLNYQLGFSVAAPRPVQLPVSMPTLGWLGMSVLQFVVGVAIVYAVKLVMKRLTVSFFSFFFGLDRLDAQHPGVMVGSTYTTYLCLGLTIAFLDPLLFTLLGFGRPGYYQEVL